MPFSSEFLDSIYSDILLILLTIVLIVGTWICEKFRRKVFQRHKTEISSKEKTRAQWAILLPRWFLKNLSFQDREWYLSLRRIQKYQWAVTLPALLYYIFLYYVASNVNFN